MGFAAELMQRRQPELMDDPRLDGEAHYRALRGLTRINWWSRSAALLWRPIMMLAQRSPERPLRVFDLACGAGDVVVDLWKRARRAGLVLELVGCDASARALELARRGAADNGADIRWMPLDVMHEPLPAGFDVLTCSLFLHHLDECAAIKLLQRMGKAAGKRVLVNDLRRSRLGVALAYVGPRLLTRSRVVHVDALRSAWAAYTMAEALRLAEQAGLRGARIAARWPQRFLLDWCRT